MATAKGDTQSSPKGEVIPVAVMIVELVEMGIVLRWLVQAHRL